METPRPLSDPLRHWPNLTADNHQVTSRRSRRYNCIAWAAGDGAHCWLPINQPADCYWPPGVPYENTLEAWIQAFATINYTVVADMDPSHQDELEKVAIYAKDNEPTHAARQQADGIWVSKLGDFEDIEHADLAALAGDYYGHVAVVLSRPRHGFTRSLPTPR